MTIEEIELRKVIKEMLSDVGINRETLKKAVKEVLEEKVENTVKQIFQEHDIDAVITKEIKDYINKNVKGYISNSITDKIEEQLKGKFVDVSFNLLDSHDYGD